MPRVSRSAVGRAAGTLLLGLAGCHGGDDPGVPLSATHRVTAGTVTRMEVPREYAVPGSVVSDERVQLSSRISGFIKDIAVREGDHVGFGQVLVQVDPADVAGAIERAQAALSSAQADLADAEDDVRKFAALAKTGSIAADTLRKAEVRRNVAAARHAEARAALATARAQQAYTTIVSPVDGVVVSRHAQAGDLATPGVPILELEARQSLVFQAFVAESRVAEIATEVPVRVTLDAVPEPIRGQVLRMVPSGDVRTRRYEVKVSLPATQGLLPGMFGRASFELGTERLLVVARAALVERGGLTGAFRVDDTGRAEFRWLRTRRELADAVEVTAGLAEADRVVLSPPATLRDGDRLELAEGGAGAGE